MQNTNPQTNPIIVVDDKLTEVEIKRARGGHGRNMPQWRNSVEFTDPPSDTNEYTVPQRRIKPRAVDIKRVARAAKKAVSATSPVV